MHRLATVPGDDGPIDEIALIEQDLSPGISIFLLNFSIFSFNKTENFFFIIY